MPGIYIRHPVKEVFQTANMTGTSLSGDLLLKWVQYQAQLDFLILCASTVLRPNKSQRCMWLKWEPLNRKTTKGDRRRTGEPMRSSCKFASTTKYTSCSFMPVFQIKSDSAVLCCSCITKQWLITMMTTEREYLVRLVHKRQLVVGLLSLPWEMSFPTCSNKLAAVICEAHKATKEEAD